MTGRFRLPDRLRRRLRLGIGGLMLAILVFGLWLGDRVNRARELRLAVAAVEADKGWVHYADEFAMGAINVPAGNSLWKPVWGTLTPGKGPTAPAWLRRSIGDEYFRELAHVSLFVNIERRRLTAPNNLATPVDDVLGLLRGQSGIKTLHLGGDTVTDKGLESMAGLTDLRELLIWWATGITDQGVAHLGRLPGLQIVDISLSKLTDDGVKHLADQPSLEDLSLEGRVFTNQSLFYLSKAKNLKSLHLQSNESEITDKGLEYLKGLKNLRSLSLGKAKVTKEAREKLIQAIPSLKFE